MKFDAKFNVEIKPKIELWTPIKTDFSLRFVVIGQPFRL